MKPLVVDFYCGLGSGFGSQRLGAEVPSAAGLRVAAGLSSATAFLTSSRIISRNSALFI